MNVRPVGMRELLYIAVCILIQSSREARGLVMAIENSPTRVQVNKAKGTLRGGATGE